LYVSGSDFRVTPRPSGSAGGPFWRKWQAGDWGDVESIASDWEAPALVTAGLRDLRIKRNRLRPGWPLIMAGLALRWFALGGLGIAVFIVLEYLGIYGPERGKGDEVGLLWAAGSLAVAILLAVVGTAILRRGERRG
jgi:hypothetical protein